MKPLNTFNDYLFFMVGLMTLATGLSPAFAQSPEDFGAVAYDIENRVVAAASGVDAAAALAAAEQACRDQGGGDSCQALGWFTNSWASLALGPTERYYPLSGAPKNVWGFAYGYADITDADKEALAICERQAGGEKCQLVHRVGIGGSAADQGTAAPLDNYVVDGFIEGEGDHAARSPDYWAVDLDTDDADPAVYPTREGDVVSAGWSCCVKDLGCQPEGKTFSSAACYGYTVAVDHGGGLSSIYTHLLNDQYLPQVGDRVTPLTRIGTMSDSGCAQVQCGTHLHYSMRRGSLDNPIYSPTAAIRTPWHECPGVAVGAPAGCETVRASNVATPVPPRHGTLSSGSTSGPRR